ncbi:hypothetical protein [Rubritepida flocculans]|uniref:hypothetical protein n=1 Tax=Rubritepida flocculans TaxID=182403 RepID=UPI0003FD8866|nr:hypothetical protein [Rubritepida flocculans]
MAPFDLADSQASAAGFARVAGRLGAVSVQVADIAGSLAALRQGLAAAAEEAGRLDAAAARVAEGAAAMAGSASRAEAALSAAREEATGAEAAAALAALAESVQRAGEEVAAMAGGAAAAGAEAAAMRTGIAAQAQVTAALAQEVTQAAQRGETLRDISEALMEEMAAAGVETEDSPFIRAAQAAAAEVGRLFEAALAAGDITEAALFDEAYRPLPGTDPPQLLAGFTALTDRLLPPVQEPLLGLDPRVVFAAAVDRNGYLPTHNAKFSQPQRPGETAWNTANCRNRRIFDDRTGLGAARNRKPFLLQAYRRDMGGGQVALMKDCSAPILVRGRHWGGFRLAYRAE